MPFGPTTTAAAAWSWVEKMLQEHPAHVGAERGERLDQHRGLDGHVQRARDAGAGQRLGVGVLGPHGHEAGHLVLGELDLLAAERGQGEVGDLEVVGHCSSGNSGADRQGSIAQLGSRAGVN